MLLVVSLGRLRKALACEYSAQRNSVSAAHSKLLYLVGLVFL